MSAKTRPTLLAGALLALVALSAPGCEVLDDLAGGGGGGGGLVDPDMPILELQRVELVDQPSQLELASYFCFDQLGFPEETAVCVIALDLPDPPSADPNDPDGMRFSFNIIFDVTNTNDFPVPVVEMLLGLQVYPETLQQNLGAMCVNFCAPDDEECQYKVDGGCATDDFPEGGTAGLDINVDVLVDGLIDLIHGDDPDWEGNGWIKTVPAGGSMELSIGFTMGIAPMIDILEEAVFKEENWDELAQGSVPEVVIPYSLEGALWFEVGRLGRAWVRFGPLDGQWELL